MPRRRIHFAVYFEGHMVSLEEYLGTLHLVQVESSEPDCSHELSFDDLGHLERLHEVLGRWLELRKEAIP